MQRLIFVKQVSDILGQSFRLFGIGGIAQQLRALLFFDSNPTAELTLFGKQIGVDTLSNVGACLGERFQQAPGAAAFADLERRGDVARVRLLPGAIASKDQRIVRIRLVAGPDSWRVDPGPGSWCGNDSVNFSASSW